jgi:hypothetical protein
MLFLALFVNEYFDLQFGWKLLKAVSIFSTLFLLLQYILMKFANYYLSGFIPGLPLAVDSLNSVSREYYLGYLNRPRSIFQEPAHYASFVLLYFGIALFLNYKKEKWGLMLTGIGLVISGSSTGILTEIGLLILWIGRLTKDILSRNKRYKAAAALFVTALSGLIIVNTNAFKYDLSRMQDSSSSINGRFGNYSRIFTLKNSSASGILFGHGMNDFEGYIPAIPGIFLYFGAVTLMIFILCNIHIKHSLMPQLWTIQYHNLLCRLCCCLPPPLLHEL